MSAYYLVGLENVVVFAVGILVVSYILWVEAYSRMFAKAMELDADRAFEMRKENQWSHLSPRIH